MKKGGFKTALIKKWEIKTMYNLHYILKDHLGSWTTITDAEGNVEQELSYDAWGNLRDPETWTGSSTEAPMFDRGYTGHEHITAFGLINMNGRCYDPLMSSFLSVDAYVQDPSNAQNFNRYAYCLNNPLKYTDPSGWMYLGGSHSPASAQNAERLAVNAALYERQSELKSPGATVVNRPAWYTEGELTVSGGGVVIKGNDGINTAYSPGMTYKGNDQFTKDAVNSLNEIYSQGGDFGKQMISTLVQSGYTYYITDLAEDGSEFVPEIHTSAYYDQNYECISPSRLPELLEEFKIGTGGTVYWNRKQQYRSDEELVQNSTMVLCHELVHAWDACWGVMQGGYDDKLKFNYREWSACYWSNRIAQDMGIPVMTHYRGKDGKYILETGTFIGTWYKVVDNYNNPIYKDRY